MKKNILFILAVSSLATGCNLVQGRASLAPLAVATPGFANGSIGEDPDTETATVEHVFLVKDNGYSSIHYQITWHGQQVIIDDPIHSTNYKTGDKIGFLVMRHDMSSAKDPKAPKLISFHALPYVPAPRP